MLLEASINTLQGKTALITLTGPLTLGTSLKTFDSQMHEAIEKRGLCQLIIDMSGVPYMDSAGLGALIHAFGLSKESGGTVRLVAPTASVQSVLRMTRTDTLLEVDDTVEASLTALG